MRDARPRDFRVGLAGLGQDAGIPRPDDFRAGRGQALEPHGALVLGSAETMVGLESGFAPVVGLRGVFKPG